MKILLNYIYLSSKDPEAMKQASPLLLLMIIGLLLLFSCSSSGNVSQQDQIREMNPQENWTLRDHLLRKPGVQVLGTGAGTRIVIRGESSTNNPGNQPLFIIDGQKAGRSFSNANDMLFEGEIKSVEVLPSSRAAQYGMEGHYGVILIHTVNSN